jgi:hypothetical protein
VVLKSKYNTMVEIKKLRKINNSIISRLFLILFPPIGEVTISEVDIRLGLVLEAIPNTLFTIGTDLSDIWSAQISEEHIPKLQFCDKDFDHRIKLWMNQEVNEEVSLEYYDFSNSDNFKDIIGKKIEEIELISIEGVSEPFGIKISLKNDFILSFPNSDGNTIETKVFNKHEGITRFNYLGKVVYLKLSQIS